jgi:hypothetical protein
MYGEIILSTAQCRKTVPGRRGRSTRILRVYRTDGEYHRCFIAEPSKLNVRRLQEMRERFPGKIPELELERCTLIQAVHLTNGGGGGGGKGALYWLKRTY